MGCQVPPEDLVGHQCSVFLQHKLFAVVSRQDAEVEGRPVVGGVVICDGELEDAGADRLVFLGERCEKRRLGFIRMFHQRHQRAGLNATWMTTVKSSRAKTGALSLMSERSMLTTVVEDKAGIPVSRALMVKE